MKLLIRSSMDTKESERKARPPRKAFLSKLFVIAVCPPCGCRIWRNSSVPELSTRCPQLGEDYSPRSSSDAKLTADDVACGGTDSDRNVGFASIPSEAKSSSALLFTSATLFVGFAAGGLVCSVADE